MNNFSSSSGGSFDASGVSGSNTGAHNQADPHCIAASIQSMFQGTYPHGILSTNPGAGGGGGAGDLGQQQALPQQQPSFQGTMNNNQGFSNMGGGIVNNSNNMLFASGAGGQQQQQQSAAMPALTTGSTVQEALQNLLGGQQQPIMQQMAQQPPLQNSMNPGMTMELRLLLQNAGVLPQQQQQGAGGNDGNAVAQQQTQNVTNSLPQQQLSSGGQQQQQQQQHSLFMMAQQQQPGGQPFPQNMMALNQQPMQGGGVANTVSSLFPSSFGQQQTQTTSAATFPAALESGSLANMNPAIAALLNTANQRRMMQQPFAPMPKLANDTGGTAMMIPTQSSAVLMNSSSTGKKAAQSLPDETTTTTSSKKEEDKKAASNPRKGKKKPKDMPRRPLSAYNLFFKDERLRMLEAHHGTLEDPTLFKPNKSKKKGNGGIGFAEMAKAISTKWKSIDAETLAHYKGLAAKDQARYKKEMDAYHRRFINTPKNDDESDGGDESDSADKEEDKPKMSDKKSATGKGDDDGSDISSDED